MSSNMHEAENTVINRSAEGSRDDSRPNHEVIKKSGKEKTFRRALEG